MKYQPRIIHNSPTENPGQEITLHLSYINSCHCDECFDWLKHRGKKLVKHEGFETTKPWGVIATRCMVTATKCVLMVIVPSWKLSISSIMLDENYFEYPTCYCRT